MKKYITLTLAAALLCPLFNNRAQAQADTATPPPNKATGGAEKMLLAGEFFTSWQNTKIDAYKGAPSITSSSFGSNPAYPTGLMLMPLIKLNDKLFLDVQVQVSSASGAAFNEGIIYYHVGNGLNIFTGFFQPRSGIYEGIMDDFTNRYTSTPVGMGIGVASQAGVGIQGGLQCGSSKVNYQLYVANGPQLVVDSTGATNGQLTYGNLAAINMPKAVGGEIGFLPFSNSSLEVGLSGQYMGSAGLRGTPLENISTTSIAAYLNYYHIFSPVMVRLQGQYEMTQTQGYNLYMNSSDTSSVKVPSFNNVLSGWFAGITLRLSGSQSPFLSNLELGARMSQLTLPQDSLCMWRQKPLNQTTVSLTYWFTWKLPLSIAYDIYSQEGAPNQSVVTVRGMWFF